ncbi:hypothetical protein D3C72_570870 [compost metagenome]
MPHASGGLQHRHTRLDTCCSQHAVHHRLTGREEVQAIGAAADHGALHLLDLVRSGDCLLNACEFTQCCAILAAGQNTHSAQTLALLVGRLKSPRQAHLAISFPADGFHQLRAKLAAQGDALITVALPESLTHGLAGRENHAVLPPLDRQHNRLVSDAGAADSALGIILAAEFRHLASATKARYLEKVLLGPICVSLADIIGNGHQAGAQLLGSIHVKQLPTDGGQVTAHGGVAGIAGKVHRFGVYRLTSVTFLLSIGGVLCTDLCVLGIAQLAGKKLYLHLLAHGIKEFRLSVLDGLGQIFHGACQGLVSACGCLCAGGKAGAAVRVGLALKSQRFIRALVQGLRHGFQALSRRLAAVILKGITPGLRHGLRFSSITSHQFAEGLGRVTGAELETGHSTVATVAAVAAAHALGRGVQSVVVFTAHALCELHYEKVMPLLGMLRLDHLTGGQLPRSRHLGAQFGLGRLSGVFGAGCLQLVIAGALLRRQAQKCLLSAVALGDVMAHHSPEVGQCLRICQGFGLGLLAASSLGAGRLYFLGVLLDVLVSGIRHQLAQRGILRLAVRGQASGAHHIGRRAIAATQGVLIQHAAPQGGHDVALLLRLVAVIERVAARFEQLLLRHTAKLGNHCVVACICCCKPRLVLLCSRLASANAIEQRHMRIEGGRLAGSLRNRRCCRCCRCCRCRIV